MIRIAVLISTFLIVSCGVDGPPLAPEGAVDQVAEDGFELIDPDGGS